MKTVKRKAEVGERILVVEDVPNTLDFKKGSILTVFDVGGNGVAVKEAYRMVRHKEYEVIIEDEPKVIKNDHGTFVVKGEESNAYISAVDVDELKDEAMKRLLTPDQAREKLKLPHRVHPKASNREHDATDYGGPLGTPIPPHSSAASEEVALNPILREIHWKIVSQTQKGLKKYGKPVHPDNHSLTEWIDHAVEESIDHITYLLMMKKKIEEGGESK